MKLLFVWTAAEFSTHDVARGYRNAFARRGFDIYDYRLSRRMIYHSKALREPRNRDIELVSRLASESIVVEALKRESDLVFIASGLTFHPEGLYYLNRIGIPTITVFTESPYDDDKQKQYADVYPEMFCGTNEIISSEKYGWLYLRAAHDPDVHRPAECQEWYDYDVLMIGTGWDDRKTLLGAIDWTGINLKLIGTWNLKKRDDGRYATASAGKLDKYIDPKVVSNEEAVGLYHRSKICLNTHRGHPLARSVNPRAIELAACNAFQISDNRAEIEDIFQEYVPTFSMDNPQELEEMIRYYLNNESDRREYSRRAMHCVANETFDTRVSTLLSSIGLTDGHITRERRSSLHERWDQRSCSN